MSSLSHLAQHLQVSFMLEDISVFFLLILGNAPLSVYDMFYPSLPLPLDILVASTFATVGNTVMKRGIHTSVSTCLHFLWVIQQFSLQFWWRYCAIFWENSTI